MRLTALSHVHSLDVTDSLLHRYVDVVLGTVAPDYLPKSYSIVCVCIWVGGEVGVGVGTVYNFSSMPFYGGLGKQALHLDKMWDVIAYLHHNLS